MIFSADARARGAGGACSEDQTAGTTMTFCSFLFMTLEGLSRHIEPPRCVYHSPLADSGAERARITGARRERSANLPLIHFRPARRDSRYCGRSACPCGTTWS